MTHAEYFRLHGTLTSARIEALLAELDEMPDAERISDLMTEALTGFVEEDAFDTVIDAIEQAFGDADLDGIDGAIAALKRLSVEVGQSSEHGVEQLNKAQDLLGWRNA